MTDPCLQGATDLCIYSGPDTIATSGDAVEMAAAARDAGMRAIVLKDPLTQTVHKARIANELLPDFECLGAAVMNLPNGGLSPRAVTFFTVLGAKLISLPTMDSAYTWFKAGQGHYLGRYATHYAYGSDNPKLTLLTAGMDQGELREEVKQILDVTAKADCTLASGFHSPRETLALAEYGQAIGYRRLLISQVNGFLDDFTPAALDRLVALGALLEVSHEVLAPFHARQPLQPILQLIKQVGAEKIILASGGGQIESPAPVEALRSFCRILTKEGITPAAIKTMVVDNPAKILNLPPVQEVER
jgi:hypothetical protein